LEDPVCTHCGREDEVIIGKDGGEGEGKQEGQGEERRKDTHRKIMIDDHDRPEERNERDIQIRHKDREGVDHQREDLCPASDLPGPFTHHGLTAGNGILLAECYYRLLTGECLFHEPV